MVGWYHWLNEHQFEQAPGSGDGQGSLVCCSPWGGEELDMTEWLSWTERYTIWWLDIYIYIHIYIYTHTHTYIYIYIHNILLVFIFLAVLGLWWGTRVSPAVVPGLNYPIAYGILVPRPGMESVFPALGGRFLTTGRPGKSLNSSYFYSYYSPETASA